MCFFQMYFYPQISYCPPPNLSRSVVRVFSSLVPSTEVNDSQRLPSTHYVSGTVLGPLHSPSSLIFIKPCCEVSIGFTSNSHRGNWGLETLNTLPKVTHGRFGTEGQVFPIPNKGGILIICTTQIGYLIALVEISQLYVIMIMIIYFEDPSRTTNPKFFSGPDFNDTHPHYPLASQTRNILISSFLWSAQYPK